MEETTHRSQTIFAIPVIGVSLPSPPLPSLIPPIVMAMPPSKKKSKKNRNPAIPNLMVPMPQAGWGASAYSYTPYGNHYHQNAVRPDHWNYSSAYWPRPPPFRPHPYAYHHDPYAPSTSGYDGYSLGPGYEVGDGPAAPKRNKRKASGRKPFTETEGAKLQLDCDVSAQKIIIRWSGVTMKNNVRYLIKAACIASNSNSHTENVGRTWDFEQPWTQTHRELRTTPGSTYAIRIECRDCSPANTLIASGTAEVRACFSMAEQAQMYQKAVEFAGSNMHQFDILYRCKPRPYWDFIRMQGQGVMAKYDKDNNGQPANQINGMIKGLFFSARLLPDGSLPFQSPFGDVRMMIESWVLLDPMKHSFYFADFYCNYLTHYVTIVVCQKGSDTDRFCEDRLFRLQIESNPFLKAVYFRDHYGNRPSYTFYVNKQVWVEIYYTEDIPMTWGRFDSIQATGAGTSKIGGLPNNKECEKCNLYPLKKDKPTAPVASTATADPEANDENGEEDLDYNEALDLTMDEDILNSTLTVLIDQGRDGFGEDWEDVVESICNLVDSVCEAEEEEKRTLEQMGPIAQSEAKIQDALTRASWSIPPKEDKFQQILQDLRDFTSSSKSQMSDLERRVSVVVGEKELQKRLDSVSWSSSYSSTETTIETASCSSTSSSRRSNVPEGIFRESFEYSQGKIEFPDFTDEIGSMGLDFMKEVEKEEREE